MRIAIIPARKNSKRLPGKNTLPYKGQPMVAHCISCAAQSGVYDRIIVSTDDPMVAAVAADVVARPPELATDTADLVDVCLHVLKDITPTAFCVVLPTAVTLKPADHSASLSLLPGADGVMGISEYRLHPYKAMVRKDGYWQPVHPQITSQSQAYEEMYAANAQLCWVKTDKFMEHRTFYLPRLAGYVIPDIDIDTAADYKEALRYEDKSDPSQA